MHSALRGGVPDSLFAATTTPLGGVWDSYYQQDGFTAFDSVYMFTASDGQLLDIDRSIDDGVLTSGLFRKMGSKAIMIIQPRVARTRCGGRLGEINFRPHVIVSAASVFIGQNVPSPPPSPAAMMPTSHVTRAAACRKAAVLRSIQFARAMECVCGRCRAGAASRVRGRSNPFP